MEKLAALCCLWAFGLGTKEDYYSELDRLFLENSEDNFLPELEGLGNAAFVCCMLFRVQLPKTSRFTPFSLRYSL